MRASYKPVVTKLAIALLVTSCGIDQGGYHPPDVLSSQTAQTVLVSGPIDAFGSLHVNGLVLDTSRAQVRIDGRVASEADLRVGQMIRAVARIDGTAAACTPTTWIFGFSSLSATEMPEINPPPPMGTMTRSMYGFCSNSSRPMVPCPAIT